MSIEDIEFMVPRETYDKFIIGLCMRTLRVIYDAEKIIHLDIVPNLKSMDIYKDISEMDLIVDAIDDFHHNFLFEPENKSKFIYSFASSLTSE
jgi:hypothetical protein